MRVRAGRSWNEPEEAIGAGRVAGKKPGSAALYRTELSHGDIVAIDGEALTPAAVLSRLNQLAASMALAGWIS